MTVGTAGDKAWKIKNALVDAARQACLPLADSERPLLVRYGRPSLQQFENYDEIIGVTDVEAAIDPATVGPRRSLDSRCTIDVIFSVFRPGDDGDLDDTDLEKVCGDRAYQLLDALEEWLRGDGTPEGNARTTLGGVALWCRCSAHRSAGATDPEFLSVGRVIEITATFTAQYRITS